MNKNSCPTAKEAGIGKNTAYLDLPATAPTKEPPTQADCKVMLQKFLEY
ncbi:MAG: hypothetical protein N3E45_01865 [Oscillatoriaceae bacterium SKW80]|nr:hypothetical protein [Oscillatoriaceae bacterium SKYG93]MCX8119574.1 hypothetical protein [Oscillatoriaceae bacterium SKW80]MDW8455041.1 hypothetical protein [Oscillatoriaceae cyanobacterium SKYGB_i_bin93]HIK28182.1 hypothetical protein [Oscillatoriaceae cyanobacterium M7585_C2015_266]